MKAAAALCIALLLYLGMPQTVAAPEVVWEERVTDRPRSGYDKYDEIQQTTIRSLRQAGDLVARIAFFADVHDRRRAAVAAAQQLRINAETAPTAVTQILLDLATALEHDDMSGVMIASERRSALENAARSYIP